MVMSAEILGRSLLVLLIYPISREGAKGLVVRGSWPRCRAALPDAWFLLIVWQFGAGERTGLPLHGDVDGVPAAAVLAHAVQGVAITHERDPLARRAFQGDRATVCDDDARIIAHLPRRISPSASCRDQLVRPVILDLEHHVTRHAIAAATVGAADRPERSMPGPDEVVWDGGTRRVGYRPARDDVGLLRGTTGSECDQSDEGKWRNDPVLAHLTVPPRSEAPSPPRIPAWRSLPATEGRA